MSRQRLTRVESHARTREELLSAAGRVFARRGYQRASIGEIADEAGYSHGAVYSNFESKDDLFLAVYENWVAGNMADLQSTLAGAGALSERARAAADDWMQRFAADPDPFLLRLELAVRAVRDPELLEKLGLRVGAVPLAIRELVEHSVQTNELELPLPPYEIALALDALSLGMALKALSDDAAARPGLLGDLTALLVDAVAKSSERKTHDSPRSAS